DLHCDPVNTRGRAVSAADRESEPVLGDGERTNVDKCIRSGVSGHDNGWWCREPALWERDGLRIECGTGRHGDGFALTHRHFRYPRHGSVSVEREWSPMPGPVTAYPERVIRGTQHCRVSIRERVTGRMLEVCETGR